jgi:hypothetical protein
MIMEIFKSVVKATLASAMLFVSVIRLGMIAYPQTPVVEYSTPDVLTLPEAKSQTVAPEIKRRIVMGQNSINNLGKAKQPQ